LRGIRRTYGHPQERVAALTKEHLIAITSSLGNSAKDILDRAMLLIGFAGAFRRSELISVDCNRIERRSAGIVISILGSKNDQATDSSAASRRVGSHGRGPYVGCGAFDDRGEQDGDAHCSGKSDDREH
jgi:site-specific recombinase XerC